MKEKQQPICTKNFDINGMEICRVGKQALLTKFFPIGNNISGNPKYSALFSMWVEHKFGEKIAYLTTRFERQVHQLRNLQIKIIYRLKKLIGKA